jgi:hypothetical protein
MGLNFNGLKEFRDSFQRLRDRGPETVDEAVKDHVVEDLYPATFNRVPKASGRLAGTAVISPGDKQGSWKLTYGDSSVNDDSKVDYAAAVHNIDKAKHAPPTSSRFVEEPLKEGVERLAERTAQALEDLAGG